MATRMELPQHEGRTLAQGCLAVVLMALVLVSHLHTADGYECIEKCNSDMIGVPIVAQSIEDNHCLIRIPDNPRQEGNRTLPCQLEIMSNCTGYCHIHLTFSKLQLDTCNRNITSNHSFCDDLHSCEYVVLRERGLDEHGDQVSEVTRFHGDLTADTYESRTDRVILQFCYRSETFSARNIQIVYRAVDPLVQIPINPGPVSVYIIGFIVVLFVISILMIRWSPWLKPCLDPPPTKQNANLDF